VIARRRQAGHVRDVDVFLVMADAFDASELAGDMRLLFDHGAAHAHFGASVRATFYTTGIEHPPTSATGTGWERTPWHATQRAAWEALTTAGVDG
jgi:hypothetical protein